jgi:hypothetical protein
MTTAMELATQMLSHEGGVEQYRHRIGDLGGAVAGLVTTKAPWSIEVKEGGKTMLMSVTPPTYVRLDEEAKAAHEAVRAALVRSGMLEHRAMVTASVEDANAYIESLGVLDAAMVVMWGVEAYGAMRKRSLMMGARKELSDQVIRASADIASRSSELPDDAYMVSKQALRAAHSELINTSPLPDAAIERAITEPLLTFEDGGVVAARRGVRERNARVQAKVIRNRQRRKLVAS